MVWYQRENHLYWDVKGSDLLIGFFSASMWKTSHLLSNQNPEIRWCFEFCLDPFCRGHCQTCHSRWYLVQVPPSQLLKALQSLVFSQDIFEINFSRMITPAHIKRTDIPHKNHRPEHLPQKRISKGYRRLSCFLYDFEVPRFSTP
jgi:hypothetical protein